MEVVASGFALAEAPLWDGESLWFSNVVGGGVRRVGPDGRVTLEIPKRRGVGGLALHEDGRLVLTGRDVLCGEAVLVGEEDGIAGYNDCGTLADGTLLVGALRFNPQAGEAPVPGELIRISPDGARTRVPLPAVRWPNGIAAAPNGEDFYLADFDRGEIWLNGTEPWAASPSGDADGLAVDSEGCVLLATGSGGSIARFAPDGSLERQIDVPAPFVSSLCFGGEDLCDLFVTTDAAVLRARAEAPGLPVPRVAARR
jgi:sugar lactone lactonase YvrE